MTTQSVKTQDLRLPHLPNGRMLIGGQWVEALGGERIKVLDPATERTIGSVARGQAADIDLAVRAADNALSNASWSKMSALDRERLLTRLANLIEENADELARIEALDNGKAVTIARNIDVVGAINTFRYFAGWPSKMSGLTLPVSSSSEDYHAYTIRQPIGVVGQIIPWNYPLVMAAWKLAPALAGSRSGVSARRCQHRHRLRLRGRRCIGSPSKGLQNCVHRVDERW